MIADYFEKTIIRFIPFRFSKWWLGIWARLVRVRRKPKIIAITGSAGKTTTKEMVAEVLMAPEARAILGYVEKTSGNANNECGVAVTLLRLPMWSDGYGMLLTLLKAPFRALSLLRYSSYPEYFVLECGTRLPGTIREIALLARPTISIVTNIGPAHLDGLGSIDAVMREKAALIEVVPPDGFVILGAGHAFVEELKSRSCAPVIVCEGLGVELSRNIARSVAYRVGIPSAVVETVLGQYMPIAGRLRRIELPRYAILDDAYNANPLSMQYGLDILKQSVATRKVAILGRMAELGEHSLKYHSEVGIHARACANIIIAVGENTKQYNADYWFPSTMSLIEGIAEILQDDDVVFIKGSHSVHLERVVEHLVASAYPAK